MSQIKHIYLIETECKKIKIGVSVNPEKRINNICSQGGLVAANTHIFSKCLNASKIEAKAKKHFEKYKINGEWFAILFSDIFSFVDKQYKYLESATSIKDGLEKYYRFVDIYNDKSHIVTSDELVYGLSIRDRSMKQLIDTHLKTLQALGVFSYHNSKTGGRPRRIYSISNIQINWLVMHLKDDVKYVSFFKKEIIQSTVNNNYIYKKAK